MSKKETQNINPQVVFSPEQIEAIKAIFSDDTGIKLGVLRVRPVAKLLGTSITTVWELSRHDPDFPRPIKITSQITAWRADELYKWLASRPRVQFKGVAENA